MAARLLLKLAVIENENFDNNATGQFNRLFQLALSGSEVTPREKFAVIDEAVGFNDEKVTAVCVEALAYTLKRHHFSRGAGAGQIGMLAPIARLVTKNWQ